MTSLRALSAAFLAFAVSISPAVGHDFQAGSITINHPWSRATPPVTPVAGGYLTLTNDGDIADRLISISSPLSDRVEIHESTVSDGVASMRPVQIGIEIGAGETVELQPVRIQALATANRDGRVLDRHGSHRRPVPTHIPSRRDDRQCCAGRKALSRLLRLHPLSRCVPDDAL